MSTRQGLIWNILVTLVATMKGWKRKTRLEVVDKIESAAAASIKEISFDQSSRAVLQAGTDKFADAVGLTLGPRGATVVLRGRGSGCLENQHGEEAHQPLLSSSNPKSIDDAKRLAENLMDTSSVDFGASSPVSYLQPAAGGTSYSGYAGIYPQATPLQQVAQVLKLSVSPVVSTVPPTLLIAASLSKPGDISSMEKERRPSQKRKFQELPAECKVPAKSKEGILSIGGTVCLQSFLLQFGDQNQNLRQSLKPATS
ncbi:hypothetical protein Bca4012_052499 [Brassica carinata]|uniref:KHDC4/BBP-like KH-domain type I domain-containing protein n=1 Tax=Brassica carinata TaxID=52824 RepID=A0A8X7R8R3_BRACI|nr:hypothetical protein Bca52824_055031 [Brassica carinata]